MAKEAYDTKYKEVIDVLNILNYTAWKIIVYQEDTVCFRISKEAKKKHKIWKLKKRVDETIKIFWANHGGFQDNTKNKFANWKLEDVKRDPGDWTIELERIGENPRKLNVHIDNTEIISKSYQTYLKYKRKL